MEIIFLQNFKTLLHCLLVPDLLSRSMKLFSFLIFKDFLFVTSFKQHDCDMPMCGFLLGVYQAVWVCGESEVLKPTSRFGNSLGGLSELSIWSYSWLGCITVK